MNKKMFKHLVNGLKEAISHQKGEKRLTTHTFDVRSPKSYKNVKFCDIKQEILQALNKLNEEDKLGHLGNVSLIDGIINLPLNQKVSGNIIVGGSVIPSIVLVDNESGRLYFYAIKCLLNRDTI